MHLIQLPDLVTPSNGAGAGLHDPEKRAFRAALMDAVEVSTSQAKEISGSLMQWEARSDGASAALSGFPVLLLTGNN